MKAVRGKKKETQCFQRVNSMLVVRCFPDDIVLGSVLEEKQRVETKRVYHDKALESLLAELEMEEAEAVAKKTVKKGKKKKGK